VIGVWTVAAHLLTPWLGPWAVRALGINLFGESALS